MQKSQASDTFTHGVTPWQVGPKEELVFTVVGRGKSA